VPKLKVGQKVRIRAIKWVGSARVLNGLTGTVVGTHPIAPDWIRIRLDPNSVTPKLDWSIPADRLVPLN